MNRKISTKKNTKETSISVSINMDGSGSISVKTGIAFMDHLIVSLAKHAMMDLKITAKSLDGIEHHLIEDTAIALGDAIDQALGNRSGIIRFGHASVPMDESLGEASVDLIRRPYHKLELSLSRTKIEGISREDLEHFFTSLLQNLNCCVHLTVKYGKNDHHKVESVMKSLAVALRAAASKDPKQKGIPSTKGKM